MMMSGIVLFLFGIGPHPWFRGHAVPRHRRVDVHGADWQPALITCSMAAAAASSGWRSEDAAMEFLKRRPVDPPSWRSGRYWYVMSAIVVAGSIALVVVRGLNLTVDFTGGLVLEVGFSQPVDLERVRSALDAGGIDDFQVRTYGTASELEVRLPPAENGRRGAMRASACSQAALDARSGGQAEPHRVGRSAGQPAARRTGGDGGADDAAARADLHRDALPLALRGRVAGRIAPRPDRRGRRDRAVSESRSTSTWSRRC